MAVHVLVILSLLVTLYQGCNGGLGAGGTNQSGTAQSGAGLTKFLKHEVVDRDVTKMTVSTYLLPEQWTAEDKFMWEYRDCFNPIRYQASWKSGDGLLEIHSVPDIAGTWMRNPMGVQGVRPPASAVAAISDFLRKSSKLQALKFIETKTVPGQKQPDYVQGNTKSQVKVENGIVKIEFTKNGQPYEGECYGTLTVMRTVTQGFAPMETDGWTLSGLSSCAAPKGRIEECKKVALTIRSSAKMTLPFYNRYTQVQKLLQNQAYARIYQAGQISKIISQTNDEISKSISDSYWDRQRSNDRINQNFSDYVRGVDRYNEPGGSEVQLPSGYGNAWVNNKGEYLMSDQSSFDPNVELKEEWKPLEKK